VEKTPEPCSANAPALKGRQTKFGPSPIRGWEGDRPLFPAVSPPAKIHSASGAKHMTKLRGAVT